MTIQQPPPQPETNPLLKWQIAVAALAVLTLTLLLINLALRGRADTAVAEREAAVAQAEQANADLGVVQRRNDELLSQLSTSSERLSELLRAADLSDKQLSAADADVAAQVRAQQRAERALARNPSPAARAAALQAQLRNAQTCSAGALLAFGQIHAGPDIESGATEAADTLEAVLPACTAGLG
jgi:hypothetical protein